MKILPEPLDFEWDSGNTDKNYEKHEVTTQEAEEPFRNELKFILNDEKHSSKEKRYMMWGATKMNRSLAIIFTLREKKVRIISARNMNKKERSAYEEKIKTYSKI